MGGLTQLQITSFRNIRHCSVAPHPALNILVGPNASGKTSFLEAIHYLATGKSFRANSVKPVIRIDDDEMVVFAELDAGAKCGLRKTRKGEQQLKLDGTALRGWEKVAREMPVQLLDDTAFALLSEGPRLRRRFLDWGVFHVEHSFLAAWRRTRKALVHRNALLKQPREGQDGQLAIWEEEFVAGAMQVTESRQQYFDRLQRAFAKALRFLNEELGEKITLQWFAGWKHGHELRELLAQSRETDRIHGVTRHGPHRADLLVKSGTDRAIDLLSRGQQKLVVSALKVAQGELFFESRERQPMYLIDDLAAELDAGNRAKVFALLQSLGAQLFVTCVDVESLGPNLSSLTGKSVFHVEHGKIAA